MNQRAGCIAGFFLSLVCFGAAIHTSLELLHLLDKGLRAEGIVYDIQRGIRGGKIAVLRFQTTEKRVVRTRDMFQLLIIRKKKGDKVDVFYDPAHPQKATVDLGIWCWQQPIAFFLGFVLIAGTTLFFCMTDSRRMKKSSET